MFDKFNFYDLLGYLLPGGTVVLTLYWIAKWGFGVPFPDLNTDFGSSVFFLGLSYVAGQVVQRCGSLYEDFDTQRHGFHRMSERLLFRAKNPYAYTDRIPAPFGPKMRGRIREAAMVTFGFADPGSEVFELCYALVVQKSLAQLTEIYLALNGLARGMVVASAIGFLASGSLALFTASAQRFVVAIVAMTGFLLGGLFMYGMFKRFRLYFAKSVYYSFLAWYDTQ